MGILGSSSFPWLSKDEYDRYHAIKERILNKELVPREDFLFVKGNDQRFNARPAYRRIIGALSQRGNVVGGYGTSQRRQKSRS